MGHGIKARYSEETLEGGVVVGEGLICRDDHVVLGELLGLGGALRAVVEIDLERASLGMDANLAAPLEQQGERADNKGLAENDCLGFVVECSRVFGFRLLF